MNTRELKVKTIADLLCRHGLSIGESKNSLISVALRALAVSVVFGLAACSSGGGSDNVTVTNSDAVWKAGAFQSAEVFADQCARPRSGTDPSTGSPFPDQQGSGLDERNFLRAWSNDIYLWYDEIVDRDPVNYDTLEYFDLLKTEALTASGNPKDNFHFAMTTDEWQSLSQSGVSVGYGATWALIKSTRPRELIVAYVEPGSPADNAGLARGARVLEIDGADLVHGDDTDTLNAGLSPAAAGETHDFRIRDLDNSERDVSLSATAVTSTPVSNVTTLANGEVGYILFNDHIATAEEGLIGAVEQLQGIQDLVLDVRYNGGGYLAIASQLAYMIAGPAHVDSQEFETLAYNDKHSRQNAPIPFYSETVGLSSLPEGQSLPTLNLPRVFVLTGPDTCSASESLINGLRGVDVEVIQIGSTTCGKPYGFYPEDNCGSTYFTIQFKGENAKGFGDYPDGFSPQNAVGGVGEQIPGCSVPDDYTRQLGDPSEARLAAALHYRSSPNEPCSFAGSLGQSKLNASLAPPSSLSAIDGRVIKSPALQGRVMHR